MSISSFRSLLLSRTKESLPIVARTILEIKNLRSAMDLLAIEKGRAINQHSKKEESILGAKVGFVPTMGFLHKGHLDLITHAKKQSEFVLSSLFVNPTQFAPHEDLARYPRAFDSDLEKLGANGCDAVFAPSVLDMYPLTRGYTPLKTFVTPIDADILTPEGVARPGFFRGVATVVSKLFNLTRPTLAVFGQKDGIQCIIIQQMVRDLNFNIQIDIVKTTRELDGLAMSSRNSYLTPEQRKAAPAIYKGLLAVKHNFETSSEYKNFLDIQQRRREIEEKEESKKILIQKDNEIKANQAAQNATVIARKGILPTTLGPLDPILKRASDQFYKILKDEGKGLLGDPQYLTFSDALTGHPLSSLTDSTARNGAVMLSTAVPILNNGTLRLIDNEMFIGEVGDIGASY